jgi:trans-AT polyketide synthase/acyltransferase/oxidoreductase domain-containing protein
VSALLYAERLNQTNRRPDFVAGHSLGEYVALFAAEVFDFETGLRLVQKRGELMARATGGAMAAVLGLARAKVDALLRESGLSTLDIANLNSPQQIVISGLRADVERAKPVFESAGALYSMLNVSGAVHSRYMVRWSDSMLHLIDQGVEEFVEVGPGTVLTGMLKYIKPPAPQAVAV